MKSENGETQPAELVSPLTLGGSGGAGEDGGGGGGLGAEPVGRLWSSMAMASLLPTLSRPPPAPAGAPEESRVLDEDMD